MKRVESNPTLVTTFYATQLFILWADVAHVFIFSDENTEPPASEACNDAVDTTSAIMSVCLAAAVKSVVRHWRLCTVLYFSESIVTCINVSCVRIV